MSNTASVEVVAGDTTNLDAHMSSQQRWEREHGAGCAGAQRAHLAAALEEGRKLRSTDTRAVSERLAGATGSLTPKAHLGLFSPTPSTPRDHELSRVRGGTAVYVEQRARCSCSSQLAPRNS